MSDRVIVPFPGNARPIVRSGNPALVLVLPVVRIDRHAEIAKPRIPVGRGGRRQRGLLKAAMDEMAEQFRKDLEARIRDTLYGRADDRV